MAAGVDESHATQKLMVEMAFPCVLKPILKDLEAESSSNSPTLLGETWEATETFYPGFTEFFVNGILNRSHIDDHVDISEAILKLEGSGKQHDIIGRRREPALTNLQQRSNSLKAILGRIPAEISDRKKFLDTIKDIANAIKHLLDAVNEVYAQVHSVDEKVNLEKKKKEFVKYSKRFSTTLKEFFKDNKRSAVYLSANHLIHQTNQILMAVA